MMQLATRPDRGGREGRNTEMRVNLYPIKGSPKGEIHLYDVTITGERRPPPSAPARGVVQKNPYKPEYNRNLLRKLSTQYSSELRDIPYAYDGKSLIYTVRKLPFQEHDFQVDHASPADDTKILHFVVSIKFVSISLLSDLAKFFSDNQEALLAPMNVLVALDVMAVHNVAGNFVSRGPSFYTPSSAENLGNGVESWGGLYSSIRTVSSGLVLNLDISHGSFYKAQSVIAYAREIWNIRDPDGLARKSPSDSEIKILERGLKTVLVEMTHQGDYKRRVRVNGITKRSADQTFFQLEQSEISVSDYFREKYKKELRYPNLPCIQAGTKNSMFPLELCSIVEGQYYRKKLSDQQTAAMIKVANKKPDVRRSSTNDYFNKAGYVDDPFLQEIGLRQDNEMMRVPARSLAPPNVLYNQRPATVQTGVWNLRGLKFTKGSKLDNWAVLAVCGERDIGIRQVENFVANLVDMAEKMNIEVLNRRPAIIRCEPTESGITGKIVSIEQEARNHRQPLKFLLCMVRGSADNYAAIKRASDQNIGFVSQCMLIKHALRINPQYLGNLLMKINCKLGGRNQQLEGNLPLFDKPIMVIGVDVTHPVGGGRNESKASIVAMVGSMDSVYSAIINTQPSRTEDVLTIRDMAAELLRRFSYNSRVFPHRIVVFRDGVSEGQFQYVFERGLKEACEEVESGYNPPITFVVCQKRHHVRFFPDRATPMDRSGNVAPCIVVDSEIVHPRQFDFYMLTHSGIQGTSRPVKYYVLFDENGFSSDKLQEFINKMAFTNARCTRSISLPPPVFYAHLAAYRGRILASIDLWESETASISTAGGTGRPAVEGVRVSGCKFNFKLHEKTSMECSMFFM